MHGCRRFTEECIYTTDLCVAIAHTLDQVK